MIKRTDKGSSLVCGDDADDDDDDDDDHDDDDYRSRVIRALAVPQLSMQTATKKGKGRNEYYYQKVKRRKEQF